MWRKYYACQQKTTFSISCGRPICWSFLMLILVIFVSSDPKTELGKLALGGFCPCQPVFRECSRFSSKNNKTHDLHKTLAAMGQTHHRSMWEILFCPPLGAFSEKGTMSSLYVMTHHSYFFAFLDLFPDPGGQNGPKTPPEGSRGPSNLDFRCFGIDF